MTASRTLCGECGSTLLICARRSCAKPFPRREHEDQRSWGSRSYCSLECAAAERQLIRFEDRVLAEKPCEQCGEPAKQRARESPASFEKRRYCSPECGFIARRKPGGPVKSEAKKDADRRYQAKKRAEHREDPVEKPLIRPVPVQPVVPQPAPGVWRPAAWRAMEGSRG